MTKLDWVQPYLAIGPRPNDELDWRTIKEEGITLIIDLNDDPVEARRSRELGIQHKGLRVDDHQEVQKFLYHHSAKPSNG